MDVKTESGIDLPVHYRASVAVQSPEGGADWVESQHIARIPQNVRAIHVDVLDESGENVLSSCRFKRSCWQDDLLPDFYARARNPFADPAYASWFEQHRVTDAELEAQRSHSFDREPLLSLVVPVYRTPVEYLRAMIDSVVAQSYAHWELVVVNASPDDVGVSEVLASYDDERIRVLEHPENDGINGNTNFGIAYAQGDYVGFVDHDDVLEPDLLHEYARAIEANPEVAMLYCDEDSFETLGEFVLPMFKPAMDVDLLYSNNYLLHVLMVSREVIEGSTRAPDEVNGAQDYDLTLKAYESSRDVIHVPRVLYHWRMHAGSSNAGNDEAKPYVNSACMQALDSHFAREDVDAHAETTDVPYVYRCVPNLDAAAAFAVIEASTPAARNDAVRNASDELLLFARGGVTMLGDGGRALAAYFERDDVGIVAPRMLCADGLSGTQWLVLRRDMGITDMGYALPASDGGYNGRFHRPCDVTAVDGTCCMVRRAEFLDLNGYDEAFKTLAFASVDLCLRYREKGKLVVFTPFSVGEYAQEPVRTFLPRSRSHEMDLVHDRMLLRERWPALVGKADPLYNPNLDEASPYFVLAD